MSTRLAILSLLASLAAPRAPAAEDLVAVLEFKNAKLSAADQGALDRYYFSDRVRIAAVDALRGGFRIMTRENMQAMASSNGVDLAKCDAENLCEVEIGRKLSASLVVSGELLKVGSFYKLVLKLHETSGGALLSGAEASGKSADELLADTDRAVAKLLEPMRGQARAPQARGDAPARLTVLSQPAAKVTLDGEELGQAPIKGRAVEPGSHLIVLTAPGYQAVSRTIEVKAGEEPTIAETLFHEAGSLELSALEGARLTVDGESVRAGRVDGLRVGPHVVRAELKGYRTLEITATVENGASTPVELQLQPLPRRVVVIPNVQATCSLDGSEPQEGRPDKPLTFEAAVGTHEISCARHGYARFTRTVALSAANDLVVQAQLREGGAEAGDVRKDARIGLAWIFLPGASFAMGCAPGDKLCGTDERPPRAVAVGNFWLTRTEVDVGAYQKCVQAGACSEPDSSNDTCNWGRRQDHPVNCVDWNQALDYCRWAGGTLPTAEEWEYAAKSGAANRYPWGKEPPKATQARFDSLDGTAAVGSFGEGSSRWGLVDLAGNVAEWTASDYSTREKEIRGGSWTDTAKDLRTSARAGQKPGYRSDRIGFRCAFHEAATPQ